MMPTPPRAVLDTVVFVQALISGRGASAGCIERLKSGRFILLLSHALIEEIREVPLRPVLTRKYPNLTKDRVDAFVREIQALSVLVAVTPQVFSLARDPKDELLIDLAVAGDAKFIVTWNEKHLTYLMNQDTPEGIDFCSRFPNLHILPPPDFLARLNSKEPLPEIG